MLKTFIYFWIGSKLLGTRKVGHIEIKTSSTSDTQDKFSNMQPSEEDFIFLWFYLSKWIAKVGIRIIGSSILTSLCK